MTKVRIYKWSENAGKKAKREIKEINKKWMIVFYGGKQWKKKLVIKKLKNYMKK